MKSLSNLQVGTLRYITKHGSVPIHVFRGVNQITAWSLAYRSNTRGPLIKRVGDLVVLTPEGETYVERYNSAKLSERKRVADLSERVQTILALVRKRQARR